MTNTNHTPRLKDTKELSAFLAADETKGWFTSIEAVNATGVLTAEVDNPVTGHVSIRAVDPYEHKLWMESRENAEVSPYYLTLVLKEITFKYNIK